MRPTTDERLQELLSLCEIEKTKTAFKEKQYLRAAQIIFAEFHNLVMMLAKEKNTLNAEQKKVILNAFGLSELKSEELREFLSAHDKNFPKATLINKLVRDGMYAMALELVVLHKDVSLDDSENYFEAFKSCVTRLNWYLVGNKVDNPAFNITLEMAVCLLSLTKDPEIAKWYSIFPDNCGYSFLHVLARIGRADLFEKAITQGASLSESSLNFMGHDQLPDRTPMGVAVFFEQEKIIELIAIQRTNRLILRILKETPLNNDEVHGIKVRILQFGNMYDLEMGNQLTAQPTNHPFHKICENAYLKFVENFQATKEVGEKALEDILSKKPANTILKLLKKDIAKIVETMDPVFGYGQFLERKELLERIAINIMSEKRKKLSKMQEESKTVLPTKQDATSILPANIDQSDIQAPLTLVPKTVVAPSPAFFVPAVSTDLNTQPTAAELDFLNQQIATKNITTPDDSTEMRQLNRRFAALHAFQKEMQSSREKFDPFIASPQKLSA